MNQDFAGNPSYCFASSSKGSAEQSTAGGTDEEGYVPTLAECRQLTRSLVDTLSRCTTYDVLGLSTQVMVLDVSSPLSVAFVAAQETRLGSGVLWDAAGKRYVGTLTSTDHLKILLYCNSHPDKTEEVSSWTIGQWLAIRNSPTLLNKPRRATKGSGRFSVATSFVSCTTSTTLKECLERMRRNDVHRLVVLSDKDGASFSVVAMIDVQQIVEYLGTRLFGKDTHGLPKSASDALLGSESGPGDSVMGNDNAVLNFCGPNRSQLPPLVSSIVSADSDSDMLREVKVGPYTSVFDIPFRCLPMIGVHRQHPIYVTMENTIAEALRLMLNENIECIAVCTENLIVTDVISRSDMLRMENQGVYDTNMTVRDAIGAKTLRMVYVFHEQDILWDIFTHFVQKRVRELFLVDDRTNQLLGQLNIVEFVYFLAFVGV